MLKPVTATTTRAAADLPLLALTAHGEDRSSELFTEPVDVSQLEAFSVDDQGRRARWLPSEVLL